MNKKYFFILLLITNITHAKNFPFSTSADEEFKKGFEKSKGISDLEKDLSEDDKFKMGGTLMNELVFSNVNSTLHNPNTLWLYGDSKLKNDIRGYVKGKLVYDPTLREDQVNPSTGKLYKKETTTLDELKLQMNLNKVIFLTAGKQKIKWGTGKFWNPTDFINNMKRDMLRSEDERSGVGLIKAHIPFGVTNLYLIGVLDDANKTSKVGQAIKIEQALFSSEIGLSYAKKNEQKSQIGADLSTAIWDFDVYGEVSYSKKSNRTFYRSTGLGYKMEEDVYNWVVGINYDYKYNDDDTVSFNAEFFSNDESQKNTSEYLFVILNRNYTPYYLSKYYLMNSIHLEKPGSFNDYSFTLINLSNISDHSSLCRLETTYKGIQDIALTMSGSKHYGKADGELRYGGQEYDFAFKARIDF